MAGPTLWLDHFKCTVHEANSTEEKDTVMASHNGYKKKGIIHTRTIIFDKASNHFQIADTIQATKNGYQVNMPFHLHPSIDVFQTSDNSYLLSHPKTSTKLEINFDSLLKTRKIDASDNGKLGWYSSSFMKKERSSVLMGEIISDQKSLTLSTTIRLTA